MSSHISEYKPGDQANGFILTQDGQWIPVAIPKLPSKRGKVIAIVAICVVALAALIWAGTVSSANQEKENQLEWCTAAINAQTDQMTGTGPGLTYTEQLRYDDECQ